MATPSMRQIGLGVALAFVLLVVGLPHAASTSRDRYDPERWTEIQY